MKYLLLIYQNPRARHVWASLPEHQRTEGLRAYAALNDELAGSGELIVTEALADAPTATRVSVKDGKTITSDGPFAETKEVLAGFYLIECDSRERAIEIAGRIPEAEVGSIEVRPVLTYDMPEE